MGLEDLPSIPPGPGVAGAINKVSQGLLLFICKAVIAVGA